MGLITERLALIIDGHTDGAVTAVRRLSLEEQAAAERAELLQAKIATLNTRIERSATGATANQRLQLSKLTNEYGALTKGLANVSPFAQKAQTALSKVGLGNLASSSTLGALGKAVPGLAAGAAVFGGFEFLKAGVDGYTQLADQIRRVAQASGASAPDASRLVAITRALGVDSDAAALGLFRLGKNIELTPQKLAMFDVAVARSKTGNVDLIGTLDNVAKAYQDTRDPAQRAAIVYEAFGRAGATMIPILSANRAQLKGIADEAKKTGRIFTSQDLQNARNYQIATRELGDAVQSLGINAARTLVPALTTAAGLLRDITAGPIASGIKGIVQSIPGVGLIGGVTHLFGGGGKHKKESPEAKAAREIASAQEQAAQQALATAAQGTLAGALDTLAGPEGVAKAKKDAAAAQTVLRDAIHARNAAQDALARGAASNGRQTGPSAIQIEAAQARVTAAEARLRAAQYVGGDARVATARASLLSSQAALNRLRASGTTTTVNLAGAEDRLRVAQTKVKNAQAGVKAAQHAVNVATGLSAADVLARLTGQASDQTKLATANVKLASSGVSDEVIGEIDKLNAQLPGTLVKVAKTINAGIVSKLNTRQSILDAAQAEFADAASNPSLFMTAGQKAGTAYVKGFASILSAGVTPTLPSPKATGGKAATNSLTSTLYPGIQINVAKVETAAKTGTALAHDLAKQARKANLGVPANFQP